MSKIRIKHQGEDESVTTRSVVRIKNKDDKQELALAKEPMIVFISCTPNLANCKSAVIRRFSVEPEEDEDDDLSDEELAKEVSLFIAKKSAVSASVVPAVGRVNRSMAVATERQFSLTNVSNEAIPRVLQPSHELANLMMGNRAPPVRVGIRHPPANLPASSPPGEEISRDTLTKILPPSALAWFDQHAVGQIEKMQLRWMGLEEAKYLKIRNEVLALYAANPSKYISPKYLKDQISSETDLGVVIRVWSLMDWLGLVNFVADPHSAPKYAKRFLDWGTGKPIESENSACSICKKTVLYTAYSLRDNGQLPPRVTESVLVCPRCFAGGRYPGGFSEESFEKIELGEASADWSSEQTLAVLEGVERYGENDWASIANNVGGKTAIQCLLHFASLPIEEKFLAPICSQGHTKKTYPFADVDNPLMALLAFLSANVHPVVASSAAHTAMKKISGEDSIKRSEEVMDEVIDMSMEGAVRQALNLAKIERNSAKSIFPKIVELQAKRIEQKLWRLSKVLPQRQV